MKLIPSGILSVLFCSVLTLNTYGSGCCGTGVPATDIKDGEKAENVCDMTMASLDLTKEQEEKLSKLKTDCEKEGCSESSRETFLKQASEILSAEQVAKLKEVCGVKKESDESGKS